MENPAHLRLNEGTPASVLSRIADLHSTDILILLAIILVLTVISFLGLKKWNEKKPEEERKSDFVLFLVALHVGFFGTVLFFVYRVVIIGLEYLSKG
ncbi:MAG: hypothetical protein D6831_00530 [Aquificota bacterium]|nr:MAG: hypothetical protein D6831_00530 [Aquificota bacterium]